MTTPTDDARSGPIGGRRRHRARTAVVVAAGLAVILAVIGLAASAARHGPGATLSGSLLVGRPAPPLAGETVTGGRASIASYRGRWVVVNFFASWCVPCQQETPELVRFAAAHPGPTDPVILGVVYQDDNGSVRDFIHRHNISWPLLSYAGTDIANSYGVAGIPVTFLVRPDGRVAAKVLGGLRAGQLDTFLAQAERGPGAVTSSPIPTAAS